MSTCRHGTCKNEVGDGLICPVCTLEVERASDTVGRLLQAARVGLLEPHDYLVGLLRQAADDLQAARSKRDQHAEDLDKAWFATGANRVVRGFNVPLAEVITNIKANRDELRGFEEKAQTFADMWATSEAKLATAYKDCREMATALHSVAPNGIELLNLAYSLELATEHVLVWRKRALAAEAISLKVPNQDRTCSACGTTFSGGPDEGVADRKAQHVCCEGDLDE